VYKLQRAQHAAPLRPDRFWRSQTALGRAQHAAPLRPDRFWCSQTALGRAQHAAPRSATVFREEEGDEATSYNTHWGPRYIDRFFPDTLATLNSVPLRLRGNRSCRLRRHQSSRRTLTLRSPCRFWRRMPVRCRRRQSRPSTCRGQYMSPYSCSAHPWWGGTDRQWRHTHLAQGKD